MKTSTFVFASLLVVAGCSKKGEEGTVQKQPLGGAATAPPAPPVEAPKPLTGQALAMKYQACIDQINAGKFDEFKAECLDGSYVAHEAGKAETSKADDLVAGFKSMKAGVPDFKLAPQIVLVSGRTILAVELVTGTHSATLKTPMGDVPATNKKLGALMFHRLTLNDANKVTEEWSYSDEPSMMGQLGLPLPGVPVGRAAREKGLDGAPVVLVATDDAQEKANHETIDKLVAALDGGKIPDAIALLAPDVVISDQSNTSDIVGTKAIEGVYKNAFATLTNRKHAFTGSWSVGNYVVRTGTFTATSKGKTFTSDLAQIFVMKDGKVTQNWIFQNGMQIATQLGLVKPPPAPTAPTMAPAMGSAAPATGSAAAPLPPAPPPPPAPAAGSAAGSAAPAGSAATK